MMGRAVVEMDRAFGIGMWSQFDMEVAYLGIT